MEIRLARGIQTDSIVDGPGLRAVVWTQGCKHDCKGCHNPTTHTFNGGFAVDIDVIKEKIKKLYLHRGITFSGGDPMEQPDECNEIAKFARGIGLDVWCYTGYTYEELLSNEGLRYNRGWRKFLDNIDVLVDGKFIEKERSLNLYFRGSRNQRVIDVQESLKLGRVVLVDKYMKEKSSLRLYEPKVCVV